MNNGRFVNQPTSIALDLVRALSALVVLFGHCVQLGLYSGPYPFSEMAQHNAVVVFFVLSGLVIATSVRSGRMTLEDYVAARVSRIGPTAVVAVAFGSAAYSIYELSPLPAAVPTPSDYAELTPLSALLPVLFLSESPFGEGPVWNPPYWSLCYEVWFYALFGAASFLKGRRRTIWILMLLLAAGPRVLMLLPLWLIGVWLAANESHRLMARRHAFLASSIAIASFGIVSEQSLFVRDQFLHYSGIDVAALRFSQFFLTDILLGAAVALGFVGLRGLATAGNQYLTRLEPFIRSAASWSFTVYLLHWPLLSLLHAVGLGGGDSILSFLLLTGSVVAICAAIAGAIEKCRPALRIALRTTLEANCRSPPDSAAKQSDPAAPATLL